jgi:alpha-L-fucosidase
MGAFFFRFMLIVTVALGGSVLAFAQTPVPTPQQLSWHKDEYYLFLHFGPNTFTGKEWGHGDEKTEIFQPDQLDTDQWCRIAKKAGASGMIITAKHHDGFCLWPSKYSTHTVRESPWRNGKGDVLKDLSASCKKYGLKFGVYLSPWDRNHPDYGTDKYNDIYVAMMTELLTQYGEIWELWWDGANGEGPNGKMQVYDFKRFEETARKLSPKTVIFSDVGPDIRWVGNEKGFAGETNWNTLNIKGFSPGAGGPKTDTLNKGNRFGEKWIPAEVDVSIRPGWFYHKEEDEKVKSPERLFEIYLQSVGRGANLLLNVPPDPRGLIHEADSAALMGFYEKRKEFAAKQIKSKSSKPDKSGYINLSLTEPAVVGAIMLREDLRKGQFCAAFEVDFLNEEKQVIETMKGTTMGNKRILTCKVPGVKYVQVRITEQIGPTSIAGITLYGD